MGSNPEAGVVAGVFADQASASKAVGELIAAHYDPHHEINVMTSHRRQRANVPIWEEFHFRSHALFGAGVGFLLAFVGVALAGLTLTPFTMVAGGPMLAAFEAGMAGGCLGFALGSLHALENTERKPEFDLSPIRDGVVWIGVQAKGNRGVKARQILATAGARHFTS
jgi:hypothetical protein